MAALETFTKLIGKLNAPGSFATQSQPREPVALDIPSQPLGDALSVFAQQSQLQILFQTSVGTKLTAPAVVGVLTPESALDRLLADTTLEYEFVDDRTVAIREREGQSKPTAERQRTGEIRMAQAEEPKDTTAPTQATQEPQLEEVMVTAQKRVQRRIDVPLSVAALSGESLERAGIDTVVDLGHAVPGLVVGDAGVLARGWQEGLP